MTRLPLRRLAPLLLAGLAAAVAPTSFPSPAHTADTRTVPEAAAVARARETVHLLDDLHKGYVVTITATYVKAQDTHPAAMVTKKVFKHMEAKGWGTGRLVDATGEPTNKENAPRTDFEKRAVARLKGGAPYYDEVASHDGKPVLCAATVVPVVMKQCLACHEGHKEGDLLGALVYEVPIK
jgi:hypothetical protein